MPWPEGEGVGFSSCREVGELVRGEVAEERLLAERRPGGELRAGSHLTPETEPVPGIVARDHPTGKPGWWAKDRNN